MCRRLVRNGGPSDRDDSAELRVAVGAGHWPCALTARGAPSSALARLGAGCDRAAVYWRRPLQRIVRRHSVCWPHRALRRA